MFSIGLKVIPQALPTTLTFLDDSSGDETVTSAKLDITKLNLQTVEYPFTGPFTLGEFTQDINFLDKDYAVTLVYTVITNVTTYTKTYEFVTLGYSNLIKKNRQFVDKEKLSFPDREQFNKDTLTINYYRMVAKDRCRFSDLVGAQQALDFIVDLNMNCSYKDCIPCQI